MKALIGAVAGAVALGLVPSAPAKDGDVLVRGTCSGASTAKLKLSPENRRLEVEFEVDANRVGQRWRVVLRQNGRVVRRASRVTRGPSGSFTARFVVADRPGADRFVATATRRGETCRVRGSF